MSRRRRGHSPVHVNIRLRCRGPIPTAAKVRQVLREILDTGTVPAGWQLAAIDWRDPTHGSLAWSEGVLSDFQNLAPLIHATLNECRIAVVRPDHDVLLQTGPYGGSEATK